MIFLKCFPFSFLPSKLVQRVFLGVLAFLCVAIFTLLHSSGISGFQETVRYHASKNNFIVRHLEGGPKAAAGLQLDFPELHVTPGTTPTKFIIDNSTYNDNTDVVVKHEVVTSREQSRAKSNSSQHDQGDVILNHSMDSKPQPKLGLMEGLKRIRPEVR